MRIQCSRRPSHPAHSRETLTIAGATLPTRPLDSTRWRLMTPEFNSDAAASAEPDSALAARRPPQRTDTRRPPAAMMLPFLVCQQQERPMRLAFRAPRRVRKAVAHRAGPSELPKNTPSAADNARNPAAPTVMVPAHPIPTEIASAVCAIGRCRCHVLIRGGGRRIYSPGRWRRIHHRRTGRASRPLQQHGCNHRFHRNFHPRSVWVIRVIAIAA